MAIVGKQIQPQKPEALADKQILRRLNDEVHKSKIFKLLALKKLPDRIVRIKEIDKNLFKKKKKNPKDQPKVVEVQAYVDNVADSEAEESEAVKVKKKIDYYLDRSIDGVYHISKATEQAFKRHKDELEWSGQDVVNKMDPYKVRLAVGALDSIRVWPYGLFGFIKKRRVLLKRVILSNLIQNFMTACVLGNTVVLSLDYYNAPQGILDFNQMANTAFTIIFAAEMGLKIMAIGGKKYIADKMNYMDGGIVLLSTVELIFLSGGAFSALRSLRIFRVFRVLRVARLLRGLKSMIQIIQVLQRSFENFVYMLMLLSLFVFIYALIGMQVFGGKYTDPTIVGTV